jgi:hypothetical protein
VKETNRQNRTVSLGRHQTLCTICHHDKRDEIEQDFISWGSINRMAKDYGVTRDSLYRHAHALRLFLKRQRSVKAALERIIERAEDVEVTASAIVQAIAAFSKINSEGRWVERTESVNLNELFDRMSVGELEEYARSGQLPAWFPVTAAATPNDGEEDSDCV